MASHTIVFDVTTHTGRDLAAGDPTVMPPTDATTIIDESGRMKSGAARRTTEVESIAGRRHPRLGVTIDAEGRLSVTLSTVHGRRARVDGMLMHVIRRMNARGSHPIGVTALAGGRRVAIIAIARRRAGQDTVPLGKVRTVTGRHQETLLEARP